MEDAMNETNTPPRGAHNSLSRGDATIAYHHTPGRGPGIVFCGGFMSDMTGLKTVGLEAWAQQQGVAYTRFDYQGHGQSSGRFEDGAVGLWAEDALAVFDHVTRGERQVLVGSSMGGWIALLVALRRPEQVAGLVGLASAPDFTEDLIWGSLGAEARATLLRDGALYPPSPYVDPPKPVTRALIEDGRRHLLLRQPIPLDAPVRLLHGMADDVVPWGTSLRLADALTSRNVRLTLIKDGDHRLSRDEDIDLLRHTVGALIEEIS